VLNVGAKVGANPMQRKPLCIKKFYQ